MTQAQLEERIREAIDELAAVTEAADARLAEAQESGDEDLIVEAQVCYDQCEAIMRLCRARPACRVDDAALAGRIAELEAVNATLKAEKERIRSLDESLDNAIAGLAVLDKLLRPVLRRP